MFSLLPTPDQVALVEATGAFLDEEMPIRRQHGPAGSDLGKWPLMATLGWFALGVPEDEGGIGADMPTLALIFRRMGRNLLTPSVLATVLAGRMASRAGSLELSSALVGGGRRAALATSSGTRAPDGSRGLLVIDGGASEAILHWSAEGIELRAADDLADRETVESFDPSLALERASLRAGSALVAASTDAVREADILVAALLVGLAEAARDMAVDYSLTREQFGRPIGTFQAVKHLCADMAVAAEVAWAQTAYASLVVGKTEGNALAHAARILAADAAIANSESNIQVHGGIGFTDEADPHLLVRRAQFLARLGGDSGAHRAAFLDSAFGSAT